MVSGRFLLLLDRGLGDFRELSEAEERKEGEAEAGDGEVYVLDGAERILVLGAKEGLAGDLRADERGETVELLKASWSASQDAFAAGSRERLDAPTAPCSDGKQRPPERRAPSRRSWPWSQASPIRTR